MRTRLTLSCLTLVALLWPIATASAREWTAPLGQKTTGEFAGLYGSYVAVANRDQARLLPLQDLSTEDHREVARALAARPPHRPAWSQSTTVVEKALQGRLQVWEGGKLVDFEPGDRPEPEIYLVYFSAHWCGPCRRFTPGLIEAYRELKADPELADRFELVFLSSDRDAREQLRYVRETEMPWTVLKYGQRGRVRALERWAGDGIPCLVALTPEGRLLFHSYRGQEYRGPEEPLQLVRELLRQMPDRLPATRLARHRLAVAQHELSAQGGRRAAQPYLITVDSQSYRRAGITTVGAVLSIDEKGHVTAAEADPQLPVVTAERFRQAAAEWLFLPQIEDGRMVPATVRLPLQF